jgi:hypothetical protein
LEFRKTKGAKLTNTAKAAGSPRPESSTSGRAGHEAGRLGVLRAKLLAFLASSIYYTPEKMLTSFPENSLLEERAILLSRVKQHEQALIIYAHKLKDRELAEQYCKQFYNRNTDEGSSMYLHLLEVKLEMHECAQLLHFLSYTPAYQQVYLKPPADETAEANVRLITCAATFLV